MTMLRFILRGANINKSLMQPCHPELRSSGPAWPPEWLVPDWPAPANVRAVFTTRQGGISTAPWDSMNLGNHVGDTPAHVNANRALLAQVTGVRSVFLQQVHGSNVAIDRKSVV